MLLLSAGLWACDNIQDPSQGLLGPQVQPQSSLLGAIETELVDPEYKLVEGGATSEFTLSNVIGPLGGKLEYGGYALNVPAGAVSEATLFTATVRADGYVAVDLRATRQAEDGSEIDVGALGFPVPVYLTMPYGQAKKLVAGSVVVVWLKDGTYTGDKEAMPTVVDVYGKRVIGVLDHFSDFGLAWPFQPTCNPLIQLC